MSREEDCLQSDSYEKSLATGTQTPPQGSESQENWATNQNVIPTLDSRLARADTFRIARRNLQNSLNSIHGKSPISNGELHLGESHCPSCMSKNQKIIDAYKNYFLAPDPNAWYIGLSKYKDVMQAQFREIQTPTKQDLRDLHLTFRLMLRQYIIDAAYGLKLDCVTELLNEISGKTAQNISFEQLVLRIDNALQTQFPNPDARRLSLGLRETTTPKERSLLYIDYYCATSTDDTPQLKNFKAKFARMFENNLSHDEVLAAMQKEAHELNDQRLSALHRELSELKLAQSAHLKNKARKAEKDQRLRDREQSPKSAICSLDNCKVKLNLNEENIECAICEWLDSKGAGKGRFFYCSADHAEDDFDSHDRNEHQCTARDRCLYYLLVGPSSETSAAGICSSCMQSKEGIFYFCSEECYHHNIDWHATRYHNSDYQRYDSNVLERFQFSESMKNLSRN